MIKHGVRQTVIKPWKRQAIEGMAGVFSGKIEAQAHPEVWDKTIWQMFETERPSLVPYAGPFDGFHSTPVSPSKTCLARYDNNKYSVMASAVGRPVEIRAYADSIEIRQDGRIVGHPRGRPLARVMGVEIVG